MLPAHELAADRDLQERLLGVRSSTDDDGDDEAEAAEAQPAPADAPAQVLTVRRAHGDGGPIAGRPAAAQAVRGFNRWNAGGTAAPVHDIPRHMPAPPASQAPAPAPAAATAKVFEFPVAASSVRAAYVVGTFDTKARELFFLRQCLEKLGLRVVTVDLSTSGKPSPASVHPREVARHHPDGEAAVFSGDRGSAVGAMAHGLRTVHPHAARPRRHHLGRRLGRHLAGHAGMRALPVGMPKVMVSTMASGDTRPYVGPSDICMMYSVTDVQGINRISEQVLANAAHALAGMITHPPAVSATSKPALGLTMFGVTTPCVQAVTKQLSDDVRLPGLPRHRRRRAEHGEAGRLGAAGRRDRRHAPPRSPTRSSAACSRPGRRGWTCSRSTRCPTSAPAAHSTW